MGLKKVEFENLVDSWVATTSCGWSVADEYRIVGGWIFPVQEGNDGERVRFRLARRPLTDPDLFRSFAHLGARGNPSKPSVQAWVEKYGVLLDEGEKGDGHASMTLETFQAEVRRANWLLNLYADIRERDLAAITSRVSNPKSPFDVRLREAFEEPEEEGGIGIRTGSEEHQVLWLGYLVLTEMVEQSLERVRLRTAVRSPEEFDPKAPRFDAGWRCPDLLSAVYLQFYLLVTAHTPMRRCENPACGMPFPYTRKNKRFCNASCRSNARHYK